MKTIKLLLLALLIGNIGIAQPTGYPALLVKTSQKGIAPDKEEFLLNRINVVVNVKQILSRDNARFSVLSPEGRLNIIKKREEKDKAGRMIWYGEIEKQKGSFVMFTIVKNVVIGEINTIKGKSYHLKYLGRNVHQITEIDKSQIKDEGDDQKRPKEGGAAIKSEKDCPDPATQIDIMVVYTADARIGAGGNDGMEALIYQCINMCNLAYFNSNINQRLNLVHFEEITYTESGDLNTDLDALTLSDGVIDNVHTLRNTYSADEVIMLVETGGAGLAWVMANPNASFETHAYGVVRRNAAASNRSFPHELGHNMGATHDCTNSNSNGDNHGFFVSNPADGGNSWRTIMSYSNCTNGPCTRLPFFSNPNIGFSPTGSATTNPMGDISINCGSDNHTIFNNTASIVANFRCSSPSVNNVWMRDSWRDTGLEPDPNTAGQDMWRSPYIWVRNSEDTPMEHQHEHQNPISGQTNFIYVKVHNGGSITSGNLEVYIANASISLSWPGGWTLVSSETVNSFASNSTRIVQIPWNTVPSAGAGDHFCLIARWVSASDPMHTVETSDINANVRNNNNIVWRNLNVIFVGPDEDASVVFNAKNNSNRPISIQIKDLALFPKVPFTEIGEVTLTLDKELYEAWRKGGFKGSGYKLEKGVIKILTPTATLQNIILKPKIDVSGKLTFKPDKYAIPNKYEVEISQWDSIFDRKKNRFISKKIGGIGYELFVKGQK